MNKVALGIVALLLLVGAIVYASRGVINRNLTQLVPRTIIRPLPSLSPLPRTSTTPPPFASPSPATQLGGITTNPLPSIRPAPSSAALPATGL